MADLSSPELGVGETHEDNSCSSKQEPMCDKAGIVRFLLAETAGEDDLSQEESPSTQDAGDKSPEKDNNLPGNGLPECEREKSPSESTGSTIDRNRTFGKVEVLTNPRQKTSDGLGTDLSNLHLSDTFQLSSASQVETSTDMPHLRVSAFRSASSKVFVSSSSKSVSPHPTAASSRDGVARPFCRPPYHIYPTSTAAPTRPPSFSTPTPATPRPRRGINAPIRDLGFPTMQPGDILRFDFPTSVTGSDKKISYFGVYVGGGSVLHCFNLSDPASNAVPWILFDWRVWAPDNYLWTAHAIVFLNRLSEMFEKGANRLCVCNKFDNIHRPLPERLIVDRAYSRLHLAFPDYLNPGFWTSWSFACWARYCVPHPNPMATFRSPLGKAGTSAPTRRAFHRASRIYAERSAVQETSLEAGEEMGKDDKDPQTP